MRVTQAKIGQKSDGGGAKWKPGEREKIPKKCRGGG